LVASKDVGERLRLAVRPGTKPPVQRFPPRTIALMFLTLAAFAWFYWRTHQRQAPRGAPPPPAVQEIQVVPMGGDR